MVNSAARQGAAVGSLLFATGRDLQVEAAPIHGRPRHHVLDFQGKGGDAFLRVANRNAHQKGCSGVDGGGQAPGHDQTAQARLGEHAVGQEQTQQHAEDQEEQVDAAVDRREAEDERGADEPLAFAGEAEPPRRPEPAPQA